MSQPPTESKPPSDQTIDGFASTQWSLVIEASADAAGPALDRLCAVYWRPVYFYIRAAGLPPIEAEDATQEFFADMLRRDWLKIADPDRGRFRGFLCRSARLFLNNRWRVANAEKRGRAAQVVPFNPQECERALAQRMTTRTDPAALYDETWADCVLRAAIDRLGVEQAKNRTGRDFEQLRPYLMCPPAEGDYARLGEVLGMPAGHVAVRVHRLTKRLGELIRAEILATLADPRDIESELRYLLQLVARQ